jgi:hypothetical protein
MEYIEKMIVWPEGSNPLRLYQMANRQWIKHEGAISYVLSKGKDLKDVDMTIIDYELMPYNKIYGDIVVVKGYRGDMDALDLTFERYTKIDRELKKMILKDLIDLDKRYAY